MATSDVPGWDHSEAAAAAAGSGHREGAVGAGGGHGRSLCLSQARKKSGWHIYHLEQAGEAWVAAVTSLGLGVSSRWPRPAASATVAGWSEAGISEAAMRDSDLGFWI